MSRTGLSAFVFVVTLCTSLPGADARPVGSEQARADTAGLTTTTVHVESHTMAGNELADPGTVETIGKYFADAGSFVHVQTVAPAIEFAGRSFYWIWDGSRSALGAVYGGVKSSLGTVSGTITASVYWPASTLEDLVHKLHDGTFDEFNRLVGATGFSIVGIELGISIVPDLSIEFEHVRNLNDVETANVRSQIDEYLTRTKTGLGHLEAAILRSLVNIGGYTSESDVLNGIVVNLFPSQSAVLDIHVFGDEEMRPKQILRAIEMAERSDDNAERLEDRLSKIETAIRNLSTDGEDPTANVE